MNKKELIEIFNILNNLYDTFSPERFGCTKKRYIELLEKLDKETD